MNKGFIMFSKDVFYKILNICNNNNSILQSNLLIIYQYLLSLKNNQTKFAICSLKNIQNNTKLSNKTIIKYLKFLEEYGFVFIIKINGEVNKYFFPLEDWFLNNHQLDDYANIILNNNGDLTKWNNYCYKFFKQKG